MAKESLGPNLRRCALKDSADLFAGISNIIEIITNKILAPFIFQDNEKQEVGQYYLFWLRIKVIHLF